MIVIYEKHIVYRKQKQAIKTVWLIYYLQNFTVENGVYKGQMMPKSDKYKSLGELIWINIKNHGNKIAHVSQSLYATQNYTQVKVYTLIHRFFRKYINF